MQENVYHKYMENMENTQTWTRNERYRSYDSYSADYLEALKKNVSRSPWRARFHIEAETGLLNDPNGFSYYNGKWHLFYQWFPFGAVHGLKSWVHLTSEDLVHFEKDDVLLLPDTTFDNAGAYSGSALPIDGKLFLMYTGNHRTKDWRRIPYQLGAFLNEKNELNKLEKPIIAPDFSEVTEHFRDPQIFRHDGCIYAIIGGQDLQENGIIKLYKNENKDLRSWQKVDNLKFTSDKMGYMIECPNLVFIDEKPVLIFCPQGLDKTISAYDNIYPNMYIAAEHFDANSAELVNPSRLINLDDGFDCYATQAFNAPDGRVLAISWLGLPDTNYATDAYGYQGALSLVKELSLKNGKLYQYPVEALKSLRQEEQDLNLSKVSLKENAYELEIDFAAQESTELNLMDGALLIKFDKESKKVTVIRGSEKRQVEVNIHQVNIFVDESIFEIFINKGEKVLSGRVFPDKDLKTISASHPTQVKLWNLGK
ncbi:sucrose-6-phosphate hydrolase [Lactococcus ileimucosae]|uniref:sucrose-6-phosphate hydrolase n=1 Tax=Lactococcus ileimucosae TaxID=2941329 RepID=UPI0035135B0D